ncbi:MAG: Tn3 family transposase [Pseudonocardiaceae bacterium]
MDSLTSLSGNRAHLTNLDISVAACLTAQALNITYAPIAVPDVPALARHRLGYVEHTFLRSETYAANPHLVTAQAGIAFAQVLGGGLVAAIRDDLCGALRSVRWWCLRSGGIRRGW